MNSVFYISSFQATDILLQISCPQNGDERIMTHGYMFLIWIWIHGHNIETTRGAVAVFHLRATMIATL